MKNLTDYIIEASSSEQKYFRFEFDDLEKADEFISSIEKIASEKDIYSEKISSGIKIKVNPSDFDKVDGIQDVLQQCLDGASEKDKEKSVYNKLSDQANAFNDWIDEQSSRDDDNDDKKEDDDKSDGKKDE